MVAYFALASFVPLIFLALSMLGFLNQADSSSALVSYLEDVFPDQSVESIVKVVDAVQQNATALSVVGAVALLWSSVSLFSALESAFNILYGRPNRPFLRGKALASIYMSAALVILFAGLTAGTIGYDLLRRYATERRLEPVGRPSRSPLLVSGAALFAFLQSAYYRLPNARLTHREVLPGAILGAIVLVGTLQALPLFVSLTTDVVALQALGTTFLLLVWLYVMANVIVFGAALNYVLAYVDTGREVQPRRVAEALTTSGVSGSMWNSCAVVAAASGTAPETARETHSDQASSTPRSADAARARWEWVCFQASPRTATVSLSPSGTNTGSNPKPWVPDAARAMRPSSAPSATTSRSSGAIATITQTYLARRSSSRRERLEHPADRVARRPAGGAHAGRAVEGDGLDPGVLADDPGVGRRDAIDPSAP